MLAEADDPGIVAAGSVDEISDHIGEQLRKARESADLIVDDIVFRTRIPRSVVVALEAGDFSVFSSSTYARSFLTQYSEFLKVDAKRWVDALEPISYISGDIELGKWEPGRQSQRHPKAPEREHSSGWFAAAGTLAVSCGLIFGAIKGFEFLELKLGADDGPLNVKQEDVGARIKPLPPAMSVAIKPAITAEPEERRMAGLPEEGFVEPPPRATVVRDDP